MAHTPSHSPTHSWDPELYLRHGDERARPFVELLARVPDGPAGADDPGSVRRVVDLGCGPGTLTRLLAQRWPQAQLTALDSSPAMVEAARANLAGSGASVELGDLRAWVEHDGEPADLVVSNATLQWVPGHLDLLGPLVERVAPGGWLAFQVPGNEAAPSTTLRRELAADPRFAAHLDGVAEVAAHEPAVYLERLAPLVTHLDVWETTYLHVLEGDDAVFTWFSGTGLRPTLEALPDGPGGLRARFADELRAALRTAYPRTERGTVLPFRRVFVVARR